MDNTVLTTPYVRKADDTIPMDGGNDDRMLLRSCPTIDGRMEVILDWMEVRMGDRVGLDRRRSSMALVWVVRLSTKF